MVLDKLDRGAETTISYKMYILRKSVSFRLYAYWPHNILCSFVTTSKSNSQENSVNRVDNFLKFTSCMLHAKIAYKSRDFREIISPKN